MMAPTKYYTPEESAIYRGATIGPVMHGLPWDEVHEIGQQAVEEWRKGQQWTK